MLMAMCALGGWLGGSWWMLDGNVHMGACLVDGCVLGG